MTTIRYHITLGRHGQQNALGYSIDADRRMTEQEETAIQRALSADFDGIDVTIEAEEIRGQTSDPATVIMRSLVREVEQLWPDALRGAKTDPSDARLNELERGLKMQERAIGSIGNSLKLIESLVMDLAAQRTVQQAAQPMPFDTSAKQIIAMNRGSEPGTVIATVNLPAVHETAFVKSVRFAEPTRMSGDPYTPDPPTQQQQLAAAKGFPLVGTPAVVAGDPSLPTNPNARGNGRTAEMQTGMMQVTGREARSSVISFGGRVDDKGQPVFDQHALPKVGDSLKPQSAKSDIEVP